MGTDTKVKDVSRDDHTVEMMKLIAAGIAIIVFGVPTVLGFITVWAVHRYIGLQRTHYVMLLAASLAASAAGIANNGTLLSDYFQWVKGVLLQNSDRWPPPWVSLLVFSTLTASIFGLLIGTAVAARVPQLFKQRTLDTRPHLIPDMRTRDRLLHALPEVLTVNPDMFRPDRADDSPRAFPIGVGVDGKPVELTEQEIGLHGLIFGSTGSGKTETLKVLSAGLLDLAWGGIILDLKEDIELRDWYKAYAAHHAIPFQELRLSDPDPQYWFDPMYGVPRDEARDTLLALTAFDDHFWQSINKLMLGQLVKLLFWAHEADPEQFDPPSMHEVVRILMAQDPATATKRMRAAIKLKRPEINDVTEFGSLVNPSQDERKSMTGFGAKMGQFFDTAAGATVLRPGPGRERLDVTKPGIIYIGLDSQGKQDLTGVVSAAVLQRLSVEAALRTTAAAADKPKSKRFVIVDEANWVNRMIIQNLLSRARSAGISMFLSTQGPDDWIDKDGDDFARLSQNTNVAMIMRQGSNASAELCADYLGKAEYLTSSFSHMDGTVLNVGSTKTEVGHIVTPDELRELGAGELVVRVGAPRVRLHYTRVVRRKPDTVAHRSGPPPKALPAGPTAIPVGPRVVRPPQS